MAVFFVADKFFRTVSLRLRTHPATVLCFVVALIPSFILALRLHKYNPQLNYAIIAVLAIAVSIIERNRSRRLQAKSAIDLAQAETMIERLAKGPSINHPELDQAILDSRLSLARAKAQLNNKTTSNKRLAGLAATVAGLVTTVHCIFNAANGQTTTLPEIALYLVLVACLVVVYTRWSERRRAKKLEATQSVDP